MFQSIPAAEGLSRSHDKSNEMCSKYTFTNNGCANVHIIFFLVLLKPNIAIILLFIYIAKCSNSWKDVLLNISWQEKGWNDVWWAKKIKPIVLRRCAFFSVWLSIFVYYSCDLHCRSVCLHRCVCVCVCLVWVCFYWSLPIYLHVEGKRVINHCHCVRAYVCVLCAFSSCYERLLVLTVRMDGTRYLWCRPHITVCCHKTSCQLPQDGNHTNAIWLESRG